MIRPDDELAELQEAWPGWKIWRARRSLDPVGVREGDYMATRMAADAGIHATVMCSTAEDLIEALTEQAAAVAAGKMPPSLGPLT